MSPKKTHWYNEVSRDQWKSLNAATIGYFLDGFDFNMVNLLLVPIAASFHIPLVLSSTLISAAYLSRWFGGLMFGAIGDRFGRKVSMVTSILLYAGGTFICAFAPSFWVLFAARLFIGLGMAGEYSSSTTYIMETWPKHLRNRAVGFVVAGFSLGGAVTAQVYKLVSSLLEGTKYASQDWRLFFMIGIIPVFFALWMRRSISEAQDFEEMRAQQKKMQAADPNYIPPKDMFSVLFKQGKLRSIINTCSALVTIVLLVFVFLMSSKLNLIQSVLAWIVIFATIMSYTRQFMKRRWPIGLGILIIMVAANLGNGPMQALMPTYYSTALHFSTGMVANLTSVFWVGQVIGCIVVGFVGDKWGTRKAYLFGTTASLLFLAPVFMINRPLMDKGFIWMALFVVCLMPYETAISFAALMPKYIGNFFTTSGRNAGVGFLINAAGLGQALAPVMTLSLANAVFQPMGLNLGWTLFCIVLTVATFIIVCLVINLPPRLLKLIHPDELRKQDWSDFDITSVEEQVKLDKK